MNEKANSCPKCGSTELGLGKQSGYAAIQPANKMSFGTELQHLICTNCGLVIESYVKRPDKFKGTLY